MLLAKWALGKINQIVKIALIGGVLILITWIPVIGPLLKGWADLGFGIVPGKPQTGFFTNLVGVPFYDVLPLLLLLMAFLHFTMIAGTSFAVKAMFLLSIACVFIGYQAMLDRAFSTIERDMLSLPLTFSAMLIIDFTVMVAGLFIQRAGTQGRRL
jgi:hypothetical protein